MTPRSISHDNRERVRSQERDFHPPDSERLTMLQSHSKSFRRHDKAEVFAYVSTAADAFDFEIP